MRRRLHADDGGDRGLGGDFNPVGWLVTVVSGRATAVGGIHGSVAVRLHQHVVLALQQQAEVRVVAHFRRHLAQQQQVCVLLGGRFPVITQAYAKGRVASAGRNTGHGFQQGADLRRGAFARHHYDGFRHVCHAAERETAASKDLEVGHADVMVIAGQVDG